MDLRKILYVLPAAFFLIFVTLSPFAHGTESEIEMLRKEVRELNKTVKNLTSVVEQQNKRIEQLEGRPATISDKESVAAKEPTPAVPVKKEPVITSTTTAAATETAPAPSSDAEIEALLNKVNNAPPTPGANTTDLVGVRVPTGSGAASKLLPDISVIGTFAGAFWTQDPSGDQGPNPTNTGFNFQELELALQGAVDPYFRYDAFLSFNLDEIEIEEAYFTTLSGLPRGLQFKGGQFLIPFGRQNQKHLHAWSFADQNLVNQFLLGPDNDSELGLEASYLFPLPFFLQLQGTFTNGTNDVSWGGTQKQDFLYQTRLAGSGNITDNLTVLAGTSYAFGFNDTGPGRNTQMLGGDLLLKWKPSAHRSLAWQTEYIARWKQVDGGTEIDGGLYSMIDFQFLKRWVAGFRYDQVGIPVGLVTREYKLTPALTFRPTEFSQIRLQYEYYKIANQPSHQSAILQLMFNLGVHGAHLF